MQWKHIKYPVTLFPVPSSAQRVKLLLQRIMFVYDAFWFAGSSTSVNDHRVLISIVN